MTALVLALLLVGTALALAFARTRRLPWRDPAWPGFAAEVAALVWHIRVAGRARPVPVRTAATASPAELRPAAARDASPAPPLPVASTPGPQPWQAGEIAAGLLAACEHAHRINRHLTARLLSELAAEDPGIPPWSVVDRAARRAGETGGAWLRRAEQNFDPDTPRLRLVAPDAAAEGRAASRGRATGAG